MKYEVHWSVLSNFRAVIDTEDFAQYDGDPADADAFAAFLEGDESEKKMLGWSTSNHWIETDDDVVAVSVERAVGHG